MTDTPSPPANCVVLVVEDEMLIRLGTCEALADAGFEIIDVQHADDAVAVLHDRGREIHAMFTDVQMPGSMDGVELVHLSRRSWPWIALLITSGQTRPRLEDMPQGSRFLSKPYHPAHVVTHLREMVVW